MYVCISFHGGHKGITIIQYEAIIVGYFFAPSKAQNDLDTRKVPFLL